MALRTGYVTPATLFGLWSGTPAFLPYTFNRDTDGWLGAEYLDSGPRTSTQPVTESPRSKTGRQGAGFVADFYNRIHIEPPVLDVGNLVSQQTRSVAVFNGYFESRPLSALSVLNGDGIALTGDAPTTFLPLETKNYSVTVTTDGPALIDALLQFSWADSSDDASVAVTGNRIVILPYQPTVPWTETLAWQTAVVTSANGGEQRQRLRKKARQTFRGVYPVAHGELGRAVNTVYGWIQRRWAVGVWSEATHLGSVAQGTTSVLLDTTAADYRVGGTVVLWQDNRTSEVLELLDVQPGQLTFDRPTNNEYARAAVMPCRTGTVNGNVQRRTNGHTAELEVTYDVLDNVDLNPAAPEQYAGLDVYWDAALLPDSGNIADEVITRVEVVDYGGVTTYGAPWANNRQSRQMRYVAEGPAEAWELRKFFHRRAGRWRPFWQPSFEDDLRFVGSGLVSTGLNVARDDYDVLGSDHAHVAIQYTDGSWRGRAVTGISLQGDGSLMLALDGTALNVDASAIRMVSFLALKRLDTDRVELRWAGNGVLTCEVRILEIAP